jgi:hydrogenase-4 component F
MAPRSAWCRLHAWLPDAHAEGPTPISAVLSGLLLNVALYALLRFKMLMSANPDGAGSRPADGR